MEGEEWLGSENKIYTCEILDDGRNLRRRVQPNYRNLEFIYTDKLQIREIIRAKAIVTREDD